MIFRYGTHSHAIAEVGLSVVQRPFYSARGFKQGTRHTWTTQGRLQADTVAAVTAAVNTMQDAYSVDGYDAGLYLDDGETLTHLFLDSSASIGGVRVTQLDFPDNGIASAEYSTFRTYNIQLEADFPDTSENLLSFEETLTFQGTGGPLDIHMPVLDGIPQKQRVLQKTVQRITQSGSAVGYRGYVTIPGPLFPSAEIQSQRVVTLRSPKNTRGYLSEFASDWQYVFETTTAQKRSPNVR